MDIHTPKKQTTFVLSKHASCPMYCFHRFSRVIFSIVIIRKITRGYELDNNAKKTHAIESKPTVHERKNNSQLFASKQSILKKRNIILFREIQIICQIEQTNSLLFLIFFLRAILLIDCIAINPTNAKKHTRNQKRNNN